MEMEASQKKVAETLDRLRSQMNEINKRLEAGYQQSMAAGQEINGALLSCSGDLKQSCRLPGAAGLKYPDRHHGPPAAVPVGLYRSLPSGEEKPAVSRSPAHQLLIDKFKVLLIERDLIVSEKDVADALAELELTLLESDVALPVTDAIIAHVRKSLVGKHRKIGESVDSLVVGALKEALLEVLGNGFDLLIISTPIPGRSGSCLPV